MKKEEQKRLMSIIRPAIIRLYGRQKLKMIGYNLVEYDKNSFVKYGWFTIRGNHIYKVKIEGFSNITHVGIDK